VPESQVRSVTAVLKANFSGYDTAMARSAGVTKKAAGEMAAASKSAAKEIEAATKKTAAANERAAKEIQRSASAAERAATREAAAAEKAAGREEAAAKKSAATAEREQAKKAAAAEKAAAREERAVRAMANAESAAYREQAAMAAAAGKASQRAADERHAAMSDLGTTIGVGSAAMIAAAAMAIKGYADFEAQMSRVGAAMDANAGQMDRLKIAALEAGKATKYSATEAAQAEEELGKAGLTVSEIVGGGLTASMNLAAAGGMELADAAEIAATTMKTFSLSTSEVPKVADALAAGAGKAVGSVGELGYALKMSGLVANQLGMSMTDTVGTLSAFAQNALLGSDAGTSLKTMLSFLQPKSAAAASAMEDLGLKFHDSQGKFVGITEVAGQLQSKLGGLTQEQRMSTMYTIFGSDAIRAANILYKEGADGIAKWIKAVEDEGYAARVAAKAQDNLKGDIEKLGGAIETALIQSGGGGAAGLRELTRAATKAVDAFSSLPAPVSNIITVVGLIAGVGGLAAASFLKVRASIWETRASMAALGVTATSTKARMSGLLGVLRGPWGVALLAAGAATASWAQKQAKAKENVRELTDTLNDQTGAVGKNTRAWISKKLIDDGMLDSARKYGLSLDVITNAAMGSSVAMNTVSQAVERFKAGNQGPGNIVAQEWQSADKFRQSLGDMSGQLDAAKENKLAYIEANKASASSATSESAALDAAAAGTEEFAGATDEAAVAAVEFAAAEKKVAEALAEANAFLSGREARRAYRRALDEATAALKKNGEGLDINTKKGMENQEALDGVATSTTALIQSLIDQQVPAGEFNRTLEDTRTSLYKTAIKFGMSKTEARKYANQIVDIPKLKSTALKLDAEKAKRDARELYNRVRSLPMKKTITVTWREEFEGYGGESAARERYGRAGLLHGATGGQIPANVGVPGRDSVPLLAMPEEYVVNREQTRRHLPLLHAINEGRLPGYASGGQVGARAAAPVSMAMPRVLMVPVTETHTTAATVHVGTVNTRDAGSFVGWGARRSFDATSGIT
jgi:TP901 family phage tail tape measure protein